MAFGPGTCSSSATTRTQILAVEVANATAGTGAINLEGIDTKVAQVFGVTLVDIQINDLAVHPTSTNVYLTVTRGTGASATPLLLRVTRNAARPWPSLSIPRYHRRSALCLTSDTPT